MAYQLTDILLNNKVPFNERSECLNEHSAVIDWLNNNIIKNIQNGWYLGGHPHLFNLPFNLLKPLFIEIDIQKLFEQLVILSFADKFICKGYSVNTTIYDPFNSFEVDGIMLDHDSSDNVDNYKLFVWENTNGFEKLENGNYNRDHIKQKLLMYQALEDMMCGKFKYCYSSLLSIDILTERGKQDTLSYLVNNSTDFCFFSLENEYPALPIMLKSDDLNWQIIQESYSFYIEKIEENIRGILNKK